MHRGVPMNLLDTTKNLPDRPLVLHQCGYEKCKPSHFFGPAIRPHYLIHFIKSGRGTYQVNGTIYHLKEGEGFLIHPGVSTLYYADETEPWEYYWIGFDGYDASNILYGCGLSQSNLIVRDYEQSNLWNSLMSLIQIFNENTGNEFTYLGMLYQCFSYVYHPVHPLNKLPYENYLKKAIDYIHSNYTYDIQISDMAKYLSIDRTYLYKLFMANLNISPQQYLIAHRLKAAKNLLLDSDFAISEIAYSCGFQDASSFNKHFKKHYQITPTAYRIVNKTKI
jgi:AraC-like DNA-binding protein